MQSDNIYDDGGADSPDALMHDYGIEEGDLASIREAGEHLIPRIEEFVGRFYDWLRKRPEYEEFFHDAEVEQTARQLQIEYWEHFFLGVVDNAYVSERRRVGETHARIGLPMHVYLASMNMSLDTLIDMCMEIKDGTRLIRPLTRLIHLDTGVVMQSYARVVGETLAAQSKSLMEMSTPVTQLWDDILMLPVVGIIDSKRAQDIMNAILRGIADTKARNFILDISGVAVVDTAVANHLIKITKATSLMGCECVISGVSPAIAQTIVELGIDVGKVRTTANMRDALSGAFGRLGFRLTTTAR